MTTAEILSLIQCAEREAAGLMLHARSILAETKTGKRDVVTEYDRRVQELLMRRLKEALPEAAFFCEENMQRDELAAETLFIIDPIDGTMNFVHGFHHSCISVAYMSRGTVLAGAVYNPYLDEMFTAERGGGAFLNGKAIHVTDATLAESLICCGTSPYSPERADQSFDVMKKAFLTGLDLRREGAAALDLCTVAAGRAGAYFELQVSLWDFAAGVLIAEEAGAVCSTLDGSPLPYDGSRPGILAGSRQAVSALLQVFGE